MQFANGRLPLTALTTVAPGMILRNSVAVAYNNMKKLALLELNDRITPAGKYGAGYRDMTAMGVFYRASQGSLPDMRKAGLDPTSRINVSPPPNSRHAQATAADVLWNGQHPNEEQLALAKRCGWSQYFGNADRNHLEHDMRTFEVGAGDKTRVIAAYLNSRHLGRTTDAVRDGHADEAFVWLLQSAGRKDGIYPEPFKIDGDWTPTGSTRTRTVLYPHYWKALWT